MLPKQYRLKRGRNLELVIKKGKKTKLSSWFGLKHLSNTKYHSRLATVIKKEVVGLASKRNQLKRKILGLLENEIKRSKENLDVVVFIYKQPKDRSDWDLLLKTVLKIIQ